MSQSIWQLTLARGMVGAGFMGEQMLVLIIMNGQGPISTSTSDTDP